MINSAIEGEPITPTYPKIMRSENVTVLFCREKCGTVLNTTTTYTVGEYREDWCMEAFKDYNGGIMLKNGV